MNLPIAGVAVDPFLLILLGFTVGVCGGFFGVGGAFMVTPALNILGFPMPYAIGTDMAHITGKSLIASSSHHKLGNVDLRAGAILVAGTFPGIELGARVVMKLEKLGTVEPVIRWVYVVVLIAIGLLMVKEQRRIKRCIKMCGPDKCELNNMLDQQSFSKKVQAIKLKPMIKLPVSGVEEISFWIILAVALITGFFAGLLGVGGGFIRVPALIYLIGMPTTVAVGTDLLEIFFSGAYGTLTYAAKGRVDVIAALVMLLGAAVGTQIGVIATNYVRGYKIRAFFAATIFLSALSVLLKQFNAGLAATVLLLSTAVLMSAIIIGSMINIKIQEKKVEVL
jgi:hypothetical protein